MHLRDKRTGDHAEATPQLRSGHDPSAPGHVAELHRSVGNRAVASLLKQRGVRAKLTVNIPGDRFEQEADRTADEITRTSCTCQGGCRKCRRSTGPVNEVARVRTSPLGTHTRAATPPIAPTVVETATRDAGEPLATDLRAHLEPRFGHDFGEVRVHRGTKADEAARALHARAYAIGRHIVFANGEYQPGTHAGLHLLAHELTHVIQQRFSSPLRVQRQTVPQVEASADTIRANLSAADRAVLSRYLELLRAGRVHTADNVEVFAAMNALEWAVRNRTQVLEQGGGALAFSEGATEHAGLGFGAAGVLLADDLTGIGVADDVAIPPAVVYGLGALVLAGVAYVAYVGLRPSQEDVDRAAEEADRLIRDVIDRVNKANTRAKPKTDPVPPTPEPDPKKTTDVFPPLPDRDRDDDDECQLIQGFPLGGNVEHDALAAFVTGQPVEYTLISPAGLTARYDGKDSADTLYEVKTGHDFLNLLDQPEARLGPRGQRVFSNAVPDLIWQVHQQETVAAVCGYEYRLATNNLNALTILRQLFPTIEVEFVAFAL